MRLHKRSLVEKPAEGAVAAGVAPGVVLGDAGYGDAAFRAGITALGLTYVVGVPSTLTVWAPGKAPLPPKPKAPGRGRPARRLGRTPDHKPVPVKDLALGLPAEAWSSVAWREGSNTPLASRFARLRVRAASDDHKRTTPHPAEWLLIEWPQGEDAPTKYWLSTLPEDTSLQVLVDMAKLRWRIERDYEDLKGEVGLAHYEGRGWRGFHHHATLCIAAYGFLVCERQAFPPSAARQRPQARLPDSYRPRGAPDPTGTPPRELDRHDPTPSHYCPGQKAPKMPLLPHANEQASNNAELMTQ